MEEEEEARPGKFGGPQAMLGDSRPSSIRRSPTGQTRFSQEPLGVRAPWLLPVPPHSVFSLLGPSVIVVLFSPQRLLSLPGSINQLQEGDTLPTAQG